MARVEFPVAYKPGTFSYLYPDTETLFTEVFEDKDTALLHATYTGVMVFDVSTLPNPFDPALPFDYSGSITPSAFMARLAPERVAIETAAPGDVDVRIVLADISMAQFIDLNATSTDTLLSTLVTKVLLTGPRKTAVLTDPIVDAERPHIGHTNVVLGESETIA